MLYMQGPGAEPAMRCGCPACRLPESAAIMTYLASAYKVSLHVPGPL